MGGNNEFFENFERKKYLKKLPSMQSVNLNRAPVRLQSLTHNYLAPLCLGSHPGLPRFGFS